AIALCALLLGASGCGGGCDGDQGGPKPGASDGGCATADARALKARGQPCSCGGDCQSGFCADGVCCNSACTETCKTCNAPSSPGVCSPVPSGVPQESTAFAGT